MHIMQDFAGHRRSKAALLETDVPKLEKLLRKGKNVTKTVIDDRMAKVCRSASCRQAMSVAQQVMQAPWVVLMLLPAIEMASTWSTACRSSRSETALQTFLMVFMGPASLQGYARPPMPNVTISMPCAHSAISTVLVEPAMCMMAC